MRAKYLLSAVLSARGKRYIHRKGCPFVRGLKDILMAGYFSAAGEAVEAAEISGYSAEPCPFCCGEYLRARNASLLRQVAFEPVAVTEGEIEAPGMFIPGAFIN